MLPAFNSSLLKKRLEQLEINKQLAFGAACCERLLPNYLAFQNETEWGEISSIRNALDVIWLYLQGESIDIQKIKALIFSCESAAPSSENFESLYVTSAQDACFAICSLLDYLIETDVDKIVQAANYATDSVDLYVQEIGNMDSSAPDLEEKILAHRLMQRELEQQEHNLNFIENASFNVEFLSQLKNSWNNNGRSNLDLP